VYFIRFKKCQATATTPDDGAVAHAPGEVVEVLAAAPGLHQPAIENTQRRGIPVTLRDRAAGVAAEGAAVEAGARSSMATLPIGTTARQVDPPRLEATVGGRRRSQGFPAGGRNGS